MECAGFGRSAYGDEDRQPQPNGKNACELGCLGKSAEAEGKGWRCLGAEAESPGEIDSEIPGGGSKGHFSTQSTLRAWVLSATLPRKCTCQVRG